MTLQFNRTTVVLIFFLLIRYTATHGQEEHTIANGHSSRINIVSGSTIHILSPEPVQYVDISSDRILGDLPLANLVRIKLLPDSVSKANEPGRLGPITIVGDNYIVQYQLEEWAGGLPSGVPSLIEISPREVRPLEVPGVGLSHGQMKNHAMGILAGRKGRPIRHRTEYGITLSLNTIHTIGDYIFLDLSFRNSSNLSYAVDELRFSIDDRKVTKATNIQSLEIKPLWQLYPLGEFRRNHRNIVVIKKTTFPGNKVLTINLTEKQVSGRTVNLRLRYKDLLDADSI